jgi:hypothetical protein
MYLHTDELIFDPLPQPYRYVNKLLLRCIEDAIDLAEGGGSAQCLNTVVGHNLRLTKVGKIPTSQMDTFFFSTAIATHEVSLYRLLGETHFIVTGTSQGNIAIYDPHTQSAVYTLSITALSKFAAARPILHLSAFETDHSHFVIVFATEDLTYLLFLSSQFILKASIELDFSVFSLDSLILSNCAQPYLVATDGTGRTAIYHCNVPSELIPPEGQTPTPTKAQQNRPIQLDPLLEIDKCPISTGPVSSETQLAQRTEDPTTRKRPPKKKPAGPPKGKGRAKSPGTIALETSALIETTKYHAVGYVFDDVAVLRFGSFPMIIIYSMQSPNPILNEFPLPSPVSAAVELTSEKHVILGLENGSFCFLNVARRTLHDHQFPRQGAIVSLLVEGDILYTFTATKAISAYRLQECRVAEKLYSWSDDDILECHVAPGAVLTLNQKSSDANVVQALSKTVNWEERELGLFPNVSVLNGRSGQYIGTAASPANLELLQTFWSREYALFVFNDPVEFKATSAERAVSPAHGKRGASPKGAKAPAAQPKKGGKGRAARKVEEAKEPEPEAAVIIKRQIIGLLPLGKTVTAFQRVYERAEDEKKRRRAKKSELDNGGDDR